MKKIILTLILALTASTAMLKAQAAISPEFEADIRKALTLTKGKETMSATMSATFEGMSAQLDMTAEETQAMSRFIVDKIYPKVEVKMIELWASHFTHEEVKGIVAFYETPVGRKIGEKAPVLAAEGAKIGAGLSSDIQAAVMQFMQQKK